MKLLKVNEATAARRRAYFHCVDETDGVTPETGEAAGQPQISLDGAAWTNTGIGTLTAIGNGRYYADLTQTLANNVGSTIETRYKSANTAEAIGDSFQVVAFDPFSDLATPTNITAGTITTVTNLTNAPTSGDLTATMKASVNTECDTALTDYDAPTNAEMEARTILAADYFDPTNDTVARVTLTDTTTTNTDMRGTDGANTVVPPTEAQMNARTRPTADYFDQTTDEVTTDAASRTASKADVSALATAAKLLAYAQLLARSDAAINTDNAAELAEINANGGSGTGDFDNQTDSEEAIRDRGDAEWTSGGDNDLTVEISEETDV